MTPYHREPDCMLNPNKFRPKGKSPQSTDIKTFLSSLSNGCCLHRYDAAFLLLVYVVYIVVLCFDLRISEFVLRKMSPCCTCLGKGSDEKTETQPLMGWNEDASLRVHSRSRTDSGIFQDDSGYSHLSLSLHGLNEIPEGEKHLVARSSSLMFKTIPVYSHVCLLVSWQSIKACLPCQRVT